MTVEPRTPSASASPTGKGKSSHRPAERHQARKATSRIQTLPTHRHHLRSCPPASLTEAAAVPCRAFPAASSHCGGRRARPGGCDRCLPCASLTTAGRRKEEAKAVATAGFPTPFLLLSARRPPASFPRRFLLCSACSARAAPPGVNRRSSTIGRGGKSRGRGGGRRAHGPSGAGAGFGAARDRDSVRSRDPSFSVADSVGTCPFSWVILAAQLQARSLSPPPPGRAPGGHLLLLGGLPGPIAQGPRPWSFSAPGMRGTW